MYSYSRDEGLTDHPCRFCGRPGACYAPPEGWPRTERASALLPDVQIAHLDCASHALNVRMLDLDVDGAVHASAVDELLRLHRCRVYAEGYPSDLLDFLGGAAVFAAFIGIYVVGSAVFP